MKKEKWIYKGRWIIFYFTNSFDISFELCEYYDNRPRINLDLLFFSLTIILPFRIKWSRINECDPPKWGVAVHHRSILVYKGNKWWSWDIPFITRDLVRTSILLKDNTWEHETKGNRKDFYDLRWKSQQKSWDYNYRDNFDGDLIPTTIYVEEREWHPKWLKCDKLFSTIERSIDVHFSRECGKEKNSWKGGVLNCSYKLLPNEHPLDCIKRMEKDISF